LLKRISLGCFDYSRNVMKDDPIPANLPVSERRRLTALVEVNWARRVQALMPHISKPSLVKNRVIKTCNEEGCAVSTEETAAGKNVKIEA
jgi:hypothetical protein